MMEAPVIINVDIWKVIGLVVVLIGSYWTMIMLMVRQFNNSLTLRFEQLEKSRMDADARSNSRLMLLEAAQKQTERDLLEMKAELPDKYVKREDAIRSEMTLHAKFDGLASTLHEYFRGNKNV